MGKFLRRIFVDTKLLLLIFILFLGFSVRVVHLSTVPFGFFCDEAAVGVDAYSILHTGRDQYGAYFPVFFKSLGDYRPGVSVYSAVPFIWLFGLSEFSVRLESVMFGMLTIIGLYLLGRELYSRSVGLWGAFTGATMPWLIHYDRTGFGFGCYAALFTIAVFCFVKAIKRSAYIMPAFILFGITLYTYQPARLIVPLFLFWLCILYRKELFLQKRYSAAGMFIFFIISIPLLVSFVDGTGIARYKLASVFNAHVSPAKTLAIMIGNYLTLLSPTLFLKGEPGFITRHFINGLIPLLPVTVFFLFIGFLELVLTIRSKRSQMLALWLVIYPVAGAVVLEAPFTSRAIMGAPLLAFLIGLGITRSITICKKIVPKELLIAIIACILLINLSLFTNYYFNEYPVNSSDFWGWQYGPRDIISYFSARQDLYDDLIMYPQFNAPQIFFKFYAPTDCSKCRIGTPHESYVAGRKQLFAVPPDYFTTHPTIRLQTKKILYYPNGSQALLIGEVIQ